MKLIIILLLSISSTLSAQKDYSKFNFEFGTGLHSFSMTKINKYYLNEFAIPLGIFDDEFNRGSSIYASIKFQPSAIYSIGIYGNYQTGSINKTESVSFTNEMGGIIGPYKRTNKLQSTANSFGISANYYLNKILKFKEKEKKLLSRLNISTELNLGYGFNETNISFLVPDNKDFSFEEIHNSSGTQVQLAINMGYNYLKNKIFSSIGMKFGYQYFKTNSLKDNNKNEWLFGVNQIPMNTDYSGFFITIFLSFGK